MPDFDVLYPKNERQGFDGGLNDKFGKHLIGDNESPDCLNVIFENGAVETRLGTSKVNTTAVGALVCDGLYTRHANSKTQSMCAWFGGTLWVLSGTTFSTVPSAQSIFTAGVRVGSAEYENYIFFNNGYNGGYKYNGAFTRHGISAPVSVPTLGSNATGLLSGSYSYKITYVNSNSVESDVSSVSSTFTVATKKILLTSVPTAALSAGVSARNIYRTVTSGTTYLRVATISDNSTTTYDDNIADSALGVAAPTDQGQPPQYSTIITHQNRLFCNDVQQPGLVWYSELGNPYIFKTTNFEEIGDNAGDLVQSFAIHENGVVCFTDNSCYLIHMPTTSPADWEIIKLRSSYGSRSPFGSFSYKNKTMFPAVQNDKLIGFAALSGDAIDPQATLLQDAAAGSELKSDRIEPDVFLMQSAYVGNISATVHKNKAYMAVTYGTNQTTNNRIYVFDFSISNLSTTNKQEASWTPWTGLNAAQFTIFNGELYYGTSTATGFVYQMNRAAVYTDDSAAINSYFWTKEFSGIPGDEQTFKDLRYINLLYEKSGGYYMNVTYRVDSDVSDGNTVQINLTPGSSLWGTMIWGIDNWGGGATNGEDRVFLGQLRGKRIQFRFSNQNTASQKFKVVGLQFSYNRKGRR